MKDLQIIKHYGGAIIINLTQHQMTADQYEYNNVKLKELKSEIPQEQEEFDKTLKSLLNFNTLPTRDVINLKVMQITTFALNHFMWGEIENNRYALIGGAPYLTAPLAESLKKVGIIPLYAFSKRESVETTQPDGSVVKTSVFKHAGYVEA